MRPYVVAGASLLLAVSVSRPGHAAGALASQEEIDRYEDWAQGRSPARPIDPADVPPPDSQPAKKMPWYGWQTLLVDSGSWLVGEAGGQLGGTGGTLLAVTGILGYHALAPAVHGFHHRDGALLLDLGLRIALPLIGAALDHEYLPYALLSGAGGAGASAGATAAVAVDALLLSWDTRRVHAEASAWSPRIAFGPRGVSAGLGVTF